MEQETLFSSTRWQILDALSKESASPLELSKAIRTTSANISQQLRLLELAGLVSSEKVYSSDKGKPRIKYSLSGDHAYIILTGNCCAKKKLFLLTDYQRFVLSACFLDDLSKQYELGKFYWDIEPFLDRIRMIAVDLDEKRLTIQIAMDEPTLLDVLVKKTKKVRIRFIESQDCIKGSEKRLVLFEKT